MEKYPKLTYNISGFSGLSSSEFELVIDNLKNRYGESFFDYLDDEDKIKEIVQENTSADLFDVTIYYVNEALKEYRFRCMEKQFR